VAIVITFYPVMFVSAVAALVLAVRSPCDIFAVRAMPVCGTALSLIMSLCMHVVVSSLLSSDDHLLRPQRVPRRQSTGRHRIHVATSRVRNLCDHILRPQNILVRFCVRRVRMLPLSVLASRSENSVSGS